MRTLLAVLALALAGCDKLWEPYIVTYGSAGSAGEAFPSTLENSYRLSRQYMLMATGNYDGDVDGVADVAVSGVFTSSDINANVANLMLARAKARVQPFDGLLREPKNVERLMLRPLGSHGGARRRAQGSTVVDRAAAERP